MELAIGENGGNYMKKKDKYTEGDSMEGVKIINDFLPSPENLIFKEKTSKVTLSLTDESIIFFKEQAKKHHTKYQTMIRHLVDEYAKKYN